MQKIPVYLMPGLGAGAKIFKGLHLPPQYELHDMHWEIPYKEESLKSYVLRIKQQIKHPNPILLGVSFGGIIIQELAKYITVKQLVIISSIKHQNEFKPSYKIAYKLKIYKILPVQILKKIDWLEKKALTQRFKQKMQLYQRFLEIDDPYYIRWSIRQILAWKQTQTLPDFVQFVGEKDPVFPPKYIKAPKIIVPNGRHDMMVYQMKWFNQHLPSYLLK